MNRVFCPTESFFSTDSFPFFVTGAVFGASLLRYRTFYHRFPEASTDSPIPDLFSGKNAKTAAVRAAVLITFS